MSTGRGCRGLPGRSSGNQVCQAMTEHADCRCRGPVRCRGRTGHCGPRLNRICGGRRQGRFPRQEPGQFKIAISIAPEYRSSGGMPHFCSTCTQAWQRRNDQGARVVSSVVQAGCARHGDGPVARRVLGVPRCPQTRSRSGCGQTIGRDKPCRTERGSPKRRRAPSCRETDARRCFGTRPRRDSVCGYVRTDERPGSCTNDSVVGS